MLNTVILSCRASSQVRACVAADAAARSSERLFCLSVSFCMERSKGANILQVGYEQKRGTLDSLGIEPRTFLQRPSSALVRRP